MGSLQTVATVGGSVVDVPEEGKVTERKNHHPSVKPIGLSKYLATMLTLPNMEDHSILVPFAGSGSEAIGALLAGWKDIVCVELKQDYADIAKERIDYWKNYV